MARVDVDDGEITSAGIGFGAFVFLQRNLRGLVRLNRSARTHRPKYADWHRRSAVHHPRRSPSHQV